jgi:hypothetical protein
VDLADLDLADLDRMVLAVRTNKRCKP